MTKTHKEKSTATESSAEGQDSAQSSSQEISSRLWTRWIPLVSEKARYCWNVCQIWRQMRCSAKTYARRTRLSGISCRGSVFCEIVSGILSLYRTMYLKTE